MQIVLISVFGLVGILSRYGLDRALAGYAATFPLSTFLINISGSFLAGVCAALGERAFVTPELQTALLVGLCGGFTTMSAFALQSALMLENGRPTVAAAYLIATPLLSVAFAFAGLIVTRKILIG